MSMYHITRAFYFSQIHYIISSWRINNYLLTDRSTVFVTKTNLVYTETHTILCSWLVCSLPLSPRLVFHTMSSLPMTVTPFITPAFSANSGLGFKQYKYCLVSEG